ncbi:hypothetical protein ONZ45_g3509 [Pleurotus djamor]|nr:hypothetical protein ONZ45_g3509 [Pleurotus djamor]
MLSRTYEAVPGFFIHDTPNVTVSQPIPPSFGLLDTSDDRWDTLFKRIAKLNHHADSKTSFKLFFLGRHGEGFHGDDEIVWGPDAEITPLGVSQAENAKAAWQTELANGLRIPDAMYVSPLSRALRTWEITFADDNRFKKAGRPLVMEACREQYGVHTCDQRRSKEFIGSTFREVVFEKGFTQDDELWTPDVREPSEHVAARVKTVIDHVFTHDKGTFISVTAHSGMINGFLASIDRPSFGLPTGEDTAAFLKNILKMKFSFANIVLAGLSIVPLVLGQVPGRDPNIGKSVTITDDIKDAVAAPPDPSGAVRGLILNISGLLQARQFGFFFPPGATLEEAVIFGPLTGPGTTTSIFKDYKVPHGSVLNPILEVEGRPNMNLNLWWKVDYNSTCLAVYSCGGTLARYSYKFDGFDCAV